MLKEERKNIDSVSISTPDHMHCLMAVEALKLGKPVYVQKPLCNNLHETRAADRIRAPQGSVDTDGDSGLVDALAAFGRSAGPQRHRR